MELGKGLEWELVWGLVWVQVLALASESLAHQWSWFGHQLVLGLVQDLGLASGLELEVATALALAKVSAAEKVWVLSLRLVKAWEPVKALE